MIQKIFSHFKKLDFWLFFIPIFLTLFGILEIWSVSKDPLYFKKQILFLLVGIFLMIFVSFFDWRIFRENPFLILGLYFLSLFLLISLLLFGPEIRGVKSWFKIGIFTFEPSELAKISLLFLLSKYFSRFNAEIYRLKHILISAIYFFPLAILIFLQPDFGAFLVLLFLWLSVLFFSGIKIRHFFVLILIFLLIFAFSFEKILKPYQKERILTFFKIKVPDPLKAGWSQEQAEIAVGSGGFFGKGIKEGSQVQLGFLPEAHTDFIFSAICEETGFFGVLILFSLYSILFLRILKIGLSFSNFEKLFAGGFLAILFSQVFFHISSNLKILPVIGLPLPFVSYGGSNLISNFFLLGILQSMKKNA